MKENWLLILHKYKLINSENFPTGTDLFDVCIITMHIKSH